VLTWIKTKDKPLYAILTGGAGVGKSVVVRALFQGLHRYLSPSFEQRYLCKPWKRALTTTDFPTPAPPVKIA
jgi:hypothetical protein